MLAAMPGTAQQPVGDPSLESGGHLSTADEREAAPAADGESLEVLLLTTGPGRALLSRFGHSAIWIRDPDSGTGEGYAFGHSDLRGLELLSMLVQGRAEARASEAEIGEMLERYIEEGRSVWVQSLNLQPTQSRALRDLLRSSRGNFRYDFFEANCTTNLRDAINEVLGGRLRDQTDPLPSERTFREHVAPFTAPDALLHAFTTLMMADGADRSISVWEEMFLPSTLREGLRDWRVSGADGTEVPFVLRERVWQAPVGIRGSEGPLPSPLAALPIGLVLGLTLSGLGFASRWGRWGQFGFFVVGSAWLLAVGFLGLGIALLWSFSSLMVAHRNENLLQASPLALLLALTVWGAKRDWKRARWFAVALVGLSFAGLALKPFAGFDQANGAVLMLTVPGHLGFAVGVWIWSSRAARPPPYRIDREIDPMDAQQSLGGQVD